MKNISIDERLAKALSLAPPEVFSKVCGCWFVPTFCGDHSFFYPHEHFGENGKKITTFTLVDMATGEKRPLFDHDELSKQLSAALGKEISSDNIPLSNAKYCDNTLTFDHGGFAWSFCGNTLTKGDALPKQRLVLSPNGQFAAYTQDENLFIKNTVTGEITQITHDGVRHHGYGGSFEGNSAAVKNKLEGYVAPAGVLWSNDSTKLLTYRIDERNVLPMYVLQNVVDESNMRPVLHEYKYSLPEDENIATAQLFLFDIEKKSCSMVMDNICLDLTDPFVGGFKIAEWSLDDNSAIIWRMNRGHNKAEIFILDGESGKIQKIFDENSDTFLFFDYYRGFYGSDTRYDRQAIRQMWYTSKENSLLWFSDRDGYMHIYDYDVANKALRKQITQGEYNIRQILKVDYEKREIYLTAAGFEEGSSPYKMKFYRCDMEDGSLTLLSPDQFEHFINLSPDGKYFVDCYSTFDEPPMVVLRDIKGKYVTTVYQADITPFDDMGISYAMPTLTKDALGQDDIHGMLLLPADFSPDKKYPVIDYYYGGNQRTLVPTNFHDFLSKGLLNSLSQMGFAVVIIDGHGTPYRNKKFHDVCYKNIGDACGMADHVAAITQLCDKFPFLDSEKVGVWGHSGGGFATYKCLVNYPEFYKCGMASGGNHMQELYISSWSERFMNQFDRELWKAQNDEFKVDNLKGQLLLIHGELDDNVHPSATMRLVDALIKADKDFEFLIMPNKHHMLSDDKYYQKRILKFFAKNLL